MAYTNFINENIAPYAAAKIGVYNSSGEKVGNIALGDFKPSYGERLYRFGILSDVHNQSDESAEPTADLQHALEVFNNKESVAFTVVCGDLTQNGTSSELQLYMNNVAAKSPDTPVYTTSGNHDATTSGINATTWESITGHPLTYEITYNGDHFLFMGMNRWEFTSSGYTSDEISWLTQKLQEYSTERTFVIMHMFFPDSAGNFKSIYPSGNWLSGTLLSQLQTLRNKYTNAIWFSGHSHWKWYLQQYETKANIYRPTNAGWNVHIPSCASPIDSDGVSTRVSMPLESEGAIIDVYADYIDIRGMDLKNTKYLPIAQYRLDTTTQPINDGSVVVTASMISENYEKTSGATFSVSGNGDVSVTFNALSQGLLVTDGTISSTDTVTVYFDEITYSATISDTAKSYIGIYGTDNSYHYDTTGFEVDVSKSAFQINSSSRYETNGGTLPITITYKHMRFIKS